MPDRHRHRHRHRHRLRVRYAECDHQGVVFNAHYLAYFDLGLTELWRAALGSYQTMLDSGHDLVVVEATVRYRRPARFDEELDLLTRVESFGTTSMAVANELTRASDGETVAQGETAYVFVDRAGAKVAVPAFIRTAFEPAAAS